MTRKMEFGCQIQNLLEFPVHWQRRTRVPAYMGMPTKHVYDSLVGRTTKKEFLSGLAELKEQLNSGKTFAVRR